MLNNENDLGYCAYLCWSLSEEKPSGLPISTNKFGLKEYVELFPEGLEAVELKRKESPVSVSQTAGLLFIHAGCCVSTCGN